MIKHNYGYACINMSLSPLGITTNRSLIQKTFKAKGLSYVSSLALQNVKDLKKIIEWNIANGFTIFRMSSDIFPWNSEYEYHQLNDYHEIARILLEIGNLCKEHNQRLSFHPDHFNKMASPDAITASKARRDIEQHSLIFDLMGFAPSHYNKINIHIGGSYEGKTQTMQRFCNNFKNLSKNAQNRLTIENDDKAALCSVKELYDGLFDYIGIPIVFDYHHHSIYPDGQSQEEAFLMAHSTWTITPIFHYSESGENGIRSHSDYIQNDINQYGKDVFIMIEAKAKDLAVLKFLECKQIPAEIA